MEQRVYSPQSLGAAISRVRKLKKLNQREAGAPFRVDQTTVSSIEQGAGGTQVDTLFRLLAALDLEIMICSKDLSSKPNDEDW